MIIERVILENFGSFKGINPIDVEPIEKQNITLLIGHAGAGKTSVGKAIRWALYNRPFHEGNEDREYTKEGILRLFFRSGGGATEDRPPTVNHMSVQLDILPSETAKAGLKEHGYGFGKFTLERTASLSGKVIPTTRDLILPQLSLKAPDQREVEDPEGIIEEFFLPASTSSFFMFHGDRIKNLTKQIEKPVTDDIKQILDVTAMNNATVDLEKVMSQLSKQVNVASKNETARIEKQTELDRLEKSIERYQRTLHEKEEERKNAREKLSRLEKENEGLLEAAGLLKDVSGKKGEIKMLEDQRDGIDESLQSMLDQFPREALYHFLYRRAFVVRETDRRNKTHNKIIEELRQKKDQIEQLKPGGKCPVCKQPFPDHLVSARQKELSAIDEKINVERQAIRPLDPEFEDLMQTVIRLESIKYNPRELKIQRFQIRNQITDKENELRGIRGKLGEYDEPNVKARASTITEDIERLSSAEGRLGEAIDKLNSDIDKFGQAKKRVEKELVFLGGEGSEKARKEFGVAESLRNVFADAVIDLADQKRDEIARMAGEMLLGITIKSDLFHKSAPVEVDDNFQVMAINANSRPLEWDVQSSSEKSLLSLSFIYGLLRASEKEAPVILDTFFGNLDPNQVTNILARLPGFGPQIILMTTLTEFNDLTTRTDSPFWSHVARFVLLRNNKSTDWTTKYKTFTDLSEARAEAVTLQAERGGITAGVKKDE
jgi:DNA sulfur modification protein DndD